MGTWAAIELRQRSLYASNGDDYIEHHDIRIRHATITRDNSPSRVLYLRRYIPIKAPVA
jgi:hypothetical protein